MKKPDCHWGSQLMYERWCDQPQEQEMVLMEISGNPFSGQRAFPGELHGKGNIQATIIAMHIIFLKIGQVVISKRLFQSGLHPGKSEIFIYRPFC